MTEVTAITSTTGMTRGQGPFPFLNKKFKDFQGHIWDKDEADKVEWVQLCLWCEGRDWAGVNRKTPQKCKSVSRLLSMIVG